MDSVRPAVPGRRTAEARRPRGITTSASAEVAAAAEREQVAAVIDDLIAADDDSEGVVTMLRHPDIRENLVDDDAVPRTDPDLLAGPRAHRRGRGPRADRRRVADAAAPLPFPEPHHRRGPRPSQARLTGAVAGAARAGRHRPDHPVLPEHQLPHARGGHGGGGAGHPGSAPGCQRADVHPHTGVPVVHGSASTWGSILDSWLEAHADGIACVIGDSTFRATSRVQSSTPELSKGLEFDLVVLIDPGAFGEGIEGAVDHYVAMTRATQQLVILTST